MEGTVRLGLEVDHSCRAVDVSTLTEDSNIINNSINDDSFTNLWDHGNDNQDQCDNTSSIEVIAKMDSNRNKKSMWLTSVLQQRRAKQTRNKHLPACCHNGATTTTTPPTCDTMDATYCVSSDGEGQEEDGKHNDHDEDHHISHNTTVDNGGRRCQVLTLNLDEYDQHQFEYLVKHKLKDRSDLTKLEIYRNNPGKDGRGTGIRSISDLGVFFSEVGGLTHLQELVLWNFNSDSSWLLTCYLKERPTLRSFRLHHASGTINNDLLKALVQVPTVMIVVLEMQQDFSLDILFSSSYLKNLKINGLYDIGRKNFARAMRILGRNNHTLRILEIKPNLSPVSIRDLSEAVQQNQTMEKLSFSFRDDSLDVSGQALIELTHALTKNRSLKEVVNLNHHSVQVYTKHNIIACESLQSNTTLERFQFYNDQACVDSMDGISNPASISDDPPMSDEEIITDCFVPCQPIYSWCNKG
jgi:hypothetical protein